MIDIEGFKKIVERSPVFAGKNVRITVIANPVAGGFTIRKRAAANEIFFREALAGTENLPALTASCTAVLHQTGAAGHARQLAHSVMETALADTDGASLYFLVTAGGDGTSLEVQSELARAVLDEGKAKLADKVCILRLPYGTGNDGSDGHTLDVSLSLLTGNARFAKQRAVRVRSAGPARKTWYAFNIASVGLDAFVTHMTNRVKNLLPGDFYKIWVDIACLFYNKMYRVGVMTVTARDEAGAVVKRHADRMILYLMGASGHRTYGSNQLILPRGDNVCGIREMPLLRKLALKKTMKDGTHAGSDETIMYTAHSIEIGYHEKILVQLDGEGHLLEPDDFPLVMELTDPFITILSR